MKKIKKNGKDVIVEEDQLNYGKHKKNNAFRFITILISTSTDPNFRELVRKDYRPGGRILLTVPEDEDLDKNSQRSVVKDYLSLDDETKVEFLRRKTQANFHILSEFKECNLLFK